MTGRWLSLFPSQRRIPTVIASEAKQSFLYMDYRLLRHFVSRNDDEGRSLQWRVAAVLVSSLRMSFFRPCERSEAIFLIHGL